jgi:16S rRNA U1498 N3-methylase RsmE
MKSTYPSASVLLEISVNEGELTVLSYNEFGMPEFELVTHDFRVLDSIKSGVIPEEFNQMAMEAKQSERNIISQIIDYRNEETLSQHIHIIQSEICI